MDAYGVQLVEGFRYAFTGETEDEVCTAFRALLEVGAKSQLLHNAINTTMPRKAVTVMHAQDDRHGLSRISTPSSANQAFEHSAGWPFCHSC